MSSQAAERQDVVDNVASAGWFVARETNKGYLIMHCGCGEHAETLHKTPSDRHHFKNKEARMLRTCATSVQ